MNEQSHQQQVNTSRAQWYVHIEAWEQSGKSQALFCRELNLSLATFSYWRTQYLEEQRRRQRLAVNNTASALAPRKHPAPRFVALEPQPQKLSANTMATVQAKLGDLSLALPLAMPVMDMALLLRALGGHHAS